MQKQYKNNDKKIIKVIDINTQKEQQLAEKYGMSPFSQIVYLCPIFSFSQLREIDKL